MRQRATQASLLATSDLHIEYQQNRDIVERMRPQSADDWLIVAGDVAEKIDDVTRALSLLADRFRLVMWVPGNHELWTPRKDPIQLRGQARYDHLVAICRELGVITPEDPYPLWDPDGDPVVVAPLFVLYDYSFRPPQARSRADAVRLAYEAGVVCTDEVLLHPDPYSSRDAWCDARIAQTERRLCEIDDAYPTVLVNHFPLIREPTDVLHYPLFALWCGTERTADWCRRFRAKVAVYGHLHIPRTIRRDGVRFEEVSVGYPREWMRHGHPRGVLRQILPAPGTG